MEVGEGRRSRVGGSNDGRYETILEYLPHGVLVIDRDLNVEFINAAARDLLGPGNDVERGQPLRDISDDLQLRSLAERLFTVGPASSGELVVTGDRTLCLDGLPAPGAESVILSIDDVTERERLRRAERQFVENAAHELRTPLAAIISIIDALESGAKDAPAVRDRFVRHLRTHSDRLQRLAISLLVLARIQTGRHAPRIELLPVRPLLDQIAEELDTAPGVAVRVEAPSDIAALTDRDLLHRAVANVGENAAKYTAAGEIVLEARTSEDRVQIEVRDTGRGMSRLDLAHALDRFYRAHGAAGDGFGLGLAIAAEAVDALGGTLALDSNPGGTGVRIEVPGATLVG